MKGMTLNDYSGCWCLVVTCGLLWLAIIEGLFKSYADALHSGLTSPGSQ